MHAQAFRMPLDVTVTSRKKGERSWRAAVVTHEPLPAASQMPRVRRDFPAPPKYRYSVWVPGMPAKLSKHVVDANSASEARAIVKARLIADPKVKRDFLLPFRADRIDGKHRLPCGTEVRIDKQLR